MTLHCREVQQSLVPFHEGTLPEEHAAALEAHLGRCAVCRTAARRQGLKRILRAGAGAPVPGPSGSFMTRLSAAVQDRPLPRQPSPMPDMLAKAGLRLAPAMAALALIISLGSAWLSAPADTAAATVPAEELLLEEHPLSTDLLLAAIHGESIER